MAPSATTRLTLVEGAICARLFCWSICSVPLADEEFASLTDRAGPIAIGSSLLLVFWLVLALGTWRLIVPVIITLVVGLIYTVGFAAFAVGRLNLVSVAFAVLFVGLAVDFGIQLGVRLHARQYSDRTFDDSLHETANRVVSQLFAVFASIALLLAAVGIYGVMSYTVTERTQELGIRAALGASARNLQSRVFGSGMRLTIIGLAIGLGATVALTRTMSSMLYGIGANDPLTIGLVAVVLSAVAALGCFVPARRISKVNPNDVLRHH